MLAQEGNKMSKIQFLATGTDECKKLEQIVGAFPLDLDDFNATLVVKLANPYSYIEASSDMFCEEFAEASINAEESNKTTGIKMQRFKGHIYSNPVESVLVLATPDKKYGLAIVHKKC